MIRPPSDLRPMLATAAPLPRDGAGWAFELKWDGIRALLSIAGGEVRVTARSGNDLTGRYPELAGLGQALRVPAVLDGEIVAFDPGGRPSFQLLQQRMHVQSAAQQARLSAEVPATFMAFDVLWLDGHLTTDLTYDQRRSLLEQLDLTGPSWRTPPVARDDATALVEFAAASGIEGIVAKSRSSRYEAGRRSRQWIKHVFRLRQELVVGGWLPGEGGRATTVGAVLVGHHVAGAQGRPGPLRYVGRVGSGFSEAQLVDLRRRVQELAADRSPFHEGSPPRQARFVEPVLVAEVAFSRWTDTGNIRQPSFLGWRDDIDPATVVRQT